MVPLFLWLVPAARGQVDVRAPGGVLSGIVRDSATGLPVGYALVVARDQRIFASEAGRFTLTGLPSGQTTLRVQQIGYRGVTLTLRVDASSGMPQSAPGLTVVLARQAFMLPELIVEGDVCEGAAALATGAESGTIIDEAFKNAERLLTTQRAYPYREVFERVTIILNAAYERTNGWVDTLRIDSRNMVGYRRGKVLEPASRGRRVGGESAVYFSTSDIAGEEFRKSHCFWYGGRDSLEGFPGYRIDFAPTRKTKGADWAGSLLIDSASMRLLQSQAHLVNLPKKGTTFGSAVCTVYYKEIVPTLVQESQMRCGIAQTSTPPSYVVERWLLVEHTFVGRRPDGAGPLP